MEYGIYVGLSTLAVAILVHAVRATWKLSRVEKELRDYFDAQIDNIQRDIAKLERENVNRGDTVKHEIGETVSAIRQKIHDVETWNRDTFVRKDSFELVVARIEKSMEKFGDRFEEKLDKVIERIQQH